METIDFSAGVLVPFYDHDTRTVYLAGKVRETTIEYSALHEICRFRVMEIFVIMN